jgi:hypothetical protein
MPRSHVPIEQAIVQYLANYNRTHAPRTVALVRASLNKFARQSNVPRMDEMSPYYVNKFIDGAKGAWDISRLRGFLAWCRKSYGIYNLYIPPIRTPRKGLRAHAPASWEKVRICVANTRSAASRMELPHQKAVFLCGYLYGLPLEKLTQITFDELGRLPMRRDFYEFLSKIQQLSPTSHTSRPAFREWLGTEPSKACKVWKKWSGGVPFQHLVNAGDSARVQLGIRPVGGRRRRLELLEALPAATEALLEKMPALWKD